MPVTRRKAMRAIGSAGAGFALAPVLLRGQSAPIVIAGKPVEIAIASVSPSTVRITVLGSDPSAQLAPGQTPALVPAAAGTPVHRGGHTFAAVRAGNLT